MDKALKIQLTQDRHQKPLAVVRNFPGGDAEMSPIQLRAMAEALNKAATDCEAQPMGPRTFKAKEWRYPLEGNFSG